MKPYLPLALTLVALTGCGHFGRVAGPTVPVKADGRLVATAESVYPGTTGYMRVAVRTGARARFDLVDRDLDEVLVYAECAELGMSQEAFFRRDRDQNGALTFFEYITPDEVSAAVRTMRDDSVAIVDKLDTDGDRALTPAELKGLVLTPTKFVTAPLPNAIAAAVTEADTNKDGKVAQKECVTIFAFALAANYTYKF